MFNKTAILSSEAHANLKFQALGGFSFAKNLHLAPICLAEFYVAAREYPIVFVKSQEDFVPVVLTGLKEGQNLFVNADGFWAAKYVPAGVRAYPFGFANQDDEKSLVLIDEAYPGFSTETGIPLFDASKKLSKELETKLDFLRQHRGQTAMTREFSNKLKEHGVFVEKTARFGSNDNPQLQVTGVWTVDEQKLYALKDEVLLEFAKKGYLALVTAHLMSMQNFAELFGKLAAFAAPAEAETKKST